MQLQHTPDLWTVRGKFPQQDKVARRRQTADNLAHDARDQGASRERDR